MPISSKRHSSSGTLLYLPDGFSFLYLFGGPGKVNDDTQLAFALYEDYRRRLGD